MRIVSLLPAATEWLCAFGAGDTLVGRTHACDWPPAVQERPILTQPNAVLGETATSIDQAVRETVQAGLSLYTVDLDQLWALQPDLIVTQTQCAVCAVDRSALDAALADWTGMPPTVFDFAPTTFKQVVDQALALGRAAERFPEAMHMIAQGELELRTLRDRLQLTTRRVWQPRPLPASSGPSP
ncbi:MAG: ABC transporter substrate-binding protein [Rhodothermaceae bacterium]|nr:ABC transporter substrate-binding protein [Rhodothermaceae bacterium]